MSTAKMRRFLSFALRSPHFSLFNTLPKKATSGEKIQCSVHFERLDRGVLGGHLDDILLEGKKFIGEFFGVSAVSALLLNQHTSGQNSPWMRKKMGAVEICGLLPCEFSSRYYEYHQTFQVPKMEVLTYTSCM